MPDVPVEAIAEALREATPGPWSNAGYDDSAGDEGWWILAGIGMDEHAVAVTAAKVMNHNDEADAHLIANAPTWLAQLLAALEASEREYKDLAEHHRQCELAGTRLAELVKREVTGEGNLPPVDDNVLMEAVEVWDAHQWPALTPSTPPDLREDAP